VTRRFIGLTAGLADFRKGRARGHRPGCRMARAVAVGSSTTASSVAREAPDFVAQPCGSMPDRVGSVATSSVPEFDAEQMPLA